MNLLIDVCIVIDVCTRRDPHAEFSAMALQHCINQGGKLWLYVGSLQTLEYTLYRELRRDVALGTNPPTNRQLMQSRSSWTSSQTPSTWIRKSSNRP